MFHTQLCVSDGIMKRYSFYFQLGYSLCGRSEIEQKLSGGILHKLSTGTWQANFQFTLLSKIDKILYNKILISLFLLFIK